MAARAPTRWWAATRANTWTINGANAGTLFDGAITTTFANVENLTGGTSADNFTIVGRGDDPAARSRAARAPTR